jgi:hypothetical protein
VIPILRAGLILLERAETVLPASQTYHIGYVRNEETLEATCYLNKLPATFSPDDLVIITDPMLATGGTIVKVIWSLRPCPAGAGACGAASGPCRRLALGMLWSPTAPRPPLGPAKCRWWMRS